MPQEKLFADAPIVAEAIALIEQCSTQFNVPLFDVDQFKQRILAPRKRTHDLVSWLQHWVSQFSNDIDDNQHQHISVRKQVVKRHLDAFNVKFATA